MMKNQNLPYDLFVSYRWTEPDQSWVRDHLVPALETAGLRVCLDVNDFMPGRDLMLEMTRAGKESAHALAVVTPSYIEGNRMVAFEALMARRSDPGAMESRLIPLILMDAEQPEWLRGIIPVDWTNKESLNREWRKLLRTLGAKRDDSQPPPHVTQLGVGVLPRPKKPQADRITILNVEKLRPRDGAGLGFLIEVENQNSNPARITSTIISGAVAKTIQGYSPQHAEIAFYVELDSLQLSTQDDLKMDGAVYTSPEDEWGADCVGRFEHIDSTATGQQMWRYHFLVPSTLVIDSNDCLSFRLLFRRRKRERIFFYNEGETPASYIGHFMYRDFHLRLVLEDASEIKHPIDDDFLMLIANWDQKLSDEE